MTNKLATVKTVAGGGGYIIERGSKGEMTVLILNPEELYLFWIESREPGTGRWLMEYLHEMADRMRAAVCCVCELALVRFYEKFGWENTGPWQSPINDEVMYQMRRQSCG